MHNSISEAVRMRLFRTYNVITASGFYCLTPRPSVGDLNRFQPLACSSTFHHTYTFCLFGFVAYRYGWRWYKTAAMFFVQAKNSSLSSCTRMYNCSTASRSSTSSAKCVNPQQRHGCRWFHAEARFVISANLVVNTSMDGRDIKQQQVLRSKTCPLPMYRDVHR